MPPNLIEKIISRRKRCDKKNRSYGGTSLYGSFHGTNFGTQGVLVFLYPFQRMRKRILNKYKKLSAHYVCTQRSLWSEWRDLNSRPYGPEPYALPNCATPRLINILLLQVP